MDKRRTVAGKLETDSLVKDAVVALDCRTKER